jgi:hypothetical protein
MPTDSVGRLDDGFKTLVTFASKPDIKLWVKSVNPPGIDGGGGIDTTTMENTRVRTKKPKKLVEITDGEFKAAYAVAVINDIIDLIQELDTITVTFEDGDAWEMWGWLDSFVPDEVEEGAQPVATCKFLCSGESDVGVETQIEYVGSGS